MELDVHVIHYLVISTIMMFCGIYGFFTRKEPACLAHLGRAYAERNKHQFCSIQSLSFPGSSGRSFFQLVRNCYRCGRNSCCYCYYY